MQKIKRRGDVKKMKIEAIAGLEARLADSQDAEPLGEGHWALDLYDAQPPLTLELEFGKQGLEVTAAAELRFSEELDGYYMAERVTDAAQVRAELLNWVRQGG